MAIQVKIPSPGESISEVELSNWFVENGDYVEKDQEIGEVESEKATLPLIAEESGSVKLLKEVGEVVPVGEVVCEIDTSAKPQKSSKKEEKKDSNKQEESKKEEEKKKQKEETASSKKEDDDKNITKDDSTEKIKLTPVAQKMMQENNLSLDDILAGLKRITSKEVNAVLSASTGDKPESFISKEASRESERNKISNLRRKLSERLVAVKNETAMLTTFNEADMSRIIELRKKYQDQFVKKHEVKLGFMSFFTKAVTLALQEFPNINSQIEKDEIVKPSYVDVGIAVQTDKGLMVPVIRNTETLSLADIEKKIMELATKARKNRISIEDMSGGTFTITNGGIFGSMLSTPIINPPQSAILGMHNIIERPVAAEGQVVIKPMMYLALSYDHRIIDGRESVGFLVRIKELVENPEKMLIAGNQEAMLLDL